MWKKMPALLLVFSLAFNAAFLAVWARKKQPPPPPTQDPPATPRHRPSAARRPHLRDGRRWWDRLEVSDEQKTRLEESHRGLQRKTEELRRRARTHSEQLYKLLEAEPADVDAILAEQEAIDRIEKEQREAVVEQMLETRRILTPEQREAWLSMMRDFRGRRRSRGPGATSERSRPPIESGQTPQGERPEGGRPPQTAPQGGE
ncbi:MAG: periplasmic heavy metal sensor [Candidatus Brocadiaceae bacterium]|nr:periplasmic heavy metal sensor [Candidatus Brocadiaceae bacterium]